MSVEYLTVVTCDRCGKESRYEQGYDSERKIESEWASLWPETVTPFRQHPPLGRSLLICDGCITDAEREQRADMRLACQAEEFPF